MEEFSSDENGTINRELAGERVYTYVRKQHSGQLRERRSRACMHECMHACMHLHGTRTATFKHATRWWKEKKKTRHSAGHSLPLSFSTGVLFPHNRACFLSRTLPPSAPYIKWKGSSYPLPAPSLLRDTRRGW